LNDGFRHTWLYVGAGDLEIEWAQSEQEGKDLKPLADEFERLRKLDLDDPANQAEAQALLDRTAKLPERADYPYVEPSGLDRIREERRPAPELLAFDLSRDQLADKIHGAWLGRACGCLLGKPVEGWRRPRMWGYLRDSGRWPLADYFTARVPDAVAEKYNLSERSCYIEDVHCMVEDDDMNYTTIGLALMKRRGYDFTPSDVANFWLENVPILHTCTAERVAYRNFTLQMSPPESASYRNPYREWIGAQIRADFFGYAAPGAPALAADLAWRDGCISHVGNGIYGEMWVAAMLAAAFVTSDVTLVIEAGLAQIPARSRLHEAIREVLDWHVQGLDYDRAIEKLHRAWDEQRQHDWCHTISNAMVVAIALLWGELDYGRTICRAVQACFDTDCNGATAGSIAGAILGAERLPARWTSPVNDTLLTGVAGYHKVAISDLARQTAEVIASMPE